MAKFISTLAKTSLATLLIVAAALSTTNAFAVPTNPAPLDFGDDINDTELFNPNDQILAIELYDAFGLGGPGAEFGFYFAGDPNSRVTLFDEFDAPTPASAPVAFVDFQAGVVLDADGNVDLQSQFTPQSGPIGFYLEIDALNFVPLYSEDSLNPNSLDYFSAFPSLSDPLASLMGFGISDGPDVFDFAFHIVSGISPIEVSAPHASFIFFSLFAIAYRRRTR